MKSRESGLTITIGVDFDNTLVSYDDLIHRVAAERGLIDSETEANKKRVRDTIRELPGGEAEWQKVQALVYGPRIGEATPAPHATGFLAKCAVHGVKVSIVSHKTEFAAYDETGTNLRSAAMAWLEQHQFLDTRSYGLSGDDVYFESTRQEKLGRIERLECTHFIDDLEETFLEDSFPSGVAKLLYTLENLTPPPACVDLAGDWQRITDNIFHAEE